MVYGLYLEDKSTEGETKSNNFALVDPSHLCYFLQKKKKDSSL